MKVTRPSEAPSQAVQRQGPPHPAKGASPAKEKALDRFTAAQSVPSPERAPQPTASQVAEALRKQYPWVSFTFTQLNGTQEELAQLAVSAGDGVHLIMDPDVLEWMAQGEDAWMQGSQMIAKTLHDLMLQKNDSEYGRGAVIADDGEITLWSSKWERPMSDDEKDLAFMQDILERQREADERQEEARKKLKLQEKKKLNYQMSRDLARLAKGTTDKDVRSLISHMYANRQKIAANSSYDRKEVQTALAQIDHVIGRARAKIRHLKDEGDMQLQIKKAEKRKEEKRRMQLEQELKRRRRDRMTRERAAIHEKLPDLPGLRDAEERREAQAQMLLGGIAAGAITPEGSTAPPSPGPGPAGSTVVVSTPEGASVEVSITPMI